MLYREIMVVCSEIHTKHINTLCGQNVELLNVKLVVYIVTTVIKGLNENAFHVLPPRKTIHPMRQVTANAQELVFVHALTCFLCQHLLGPPSLISVCRLTGSRIYINSPHDSLCTQTIRISEQMGLIFQVSFIVRHTQTITSCKVICRMSPFWRLEF